MVIKWKQTREVRKCLHISTPSFNERESWFCKYFPTWSHAGALTDPSSCSFFSVLFDYLYFSNYLLSTSQPSSCDKYTTPDAKHSSDSKNNEKKITKSYRLSCYLKKEELNKGVSPPDCMSYKAFISYLYLWILQGIKLPHILLCICLYWKLEKEYKFVLELLQPYVNFLDLALWKKLLLCLWKITHVWGLLVEVYC